MRKNNEKNNYSFSNDLPVASGLRLCRKTKSIVKRGFAVFRIGEHEMLQHEDDGAGIFQLNACRSLSVNTYTLF